MYWLIRSSIKIWYAILAFAEFCICLWYFSRDRSFPKRHLSTCFWGSAKCKMSSHTWKTCNVFVKHLDFIISSTTESRFSPHPPPCICSVQSTHLTRGVFLVCTLYIQYVQCTPYLQYIVSLFLTISCYFFLCHCLPHHLTLFPIISHYFGKLLLPQNPFQLCTIRLSSFKLTVYLACGWCSFVPCSSSFVFSALLFGPFVVS